MRPRRRDVCQQCRSRKLGCDGKAPACGQCTLRQLPCGGYPQVFVIVPPTSNSTVKLTGSEKLKNGTSRHTKPSLAATRATSSIRTAPWRCLRVPTLLNAFDLSNDVDFIVQHYTPIFSDTTAESNPWHNQICGAWVEALPLLLVEDHIPDFLASSVSAFAAALRYHCAGSNAVVPEVLKLYGTSLEMVASALENANGVLQVEYCAAIMCLAATEIVFPTSKFSWMQHATAVGDFVERLGPSAFTTGILHKLFVGFRPLLFKSAVFNRRGSFLAGPEWTQLPFEGQTVSLSQSLFNQAVRLPTLLERFDGLVQFSSTANLSAWIQLFTDFQLLLQSFQTWEDAAQNQSTSPMYWKKPDNGHLAACDVDALWFRDLMTATSLTFCWAFGIMVLKHLGLVRHSIDTLSPARQPHNPACSNEDPNWKERVRLAEMICNSMPYFMRPEMKLWGHASTFFTFSTCVQTFKDHEVDCRAQLLRCRQIFIQLNGMKVYFPGIQELLP